MSHERAEIRGEAVHQGRETIILVHGTFAAPQHSGPLQWHEHGSAFAIALDDELARLGSAARCWAHAGDKSTGSFKVFSWSGSNHWLDREAAASELATQLDELVGMGWRCHIVAHSHGGNVVLDALRRMRKSTDPGYADAWSSGSIVTMGTPFLASRSMPHPFFPELDVDSNADAEDEGLRWVVGWSAKASLYVAAFFLLLAGGLRIAGIDVLSIRLSLGSAVVLALTIVIAVCAGIGLLAIRISNARLVGAASSPQSQRMLVMGSEHDEAWQLLHGVLARPTQDKIECTAKTEAGAQLRRPVAFWRRLWRLISDADSLAYPGRSYLVDCVVWGSVVVLLTAAKRYPTVVTILLPYLSIAYCGVLITGLVGSSYTMRACVGAPIRAARSLVVAARYIAGSIIADWFQHLAVPILRMKAAGLDYFPNAWPRVTREPQFVDPSFFKYREMSDRDMLEIKKSRDDRIGSSFGVVLAALGRYGIGARELEDLLAEIANDTTLCHAAYYMNPPYIPVIAHWIARTEEELSRRDQHQE